VPVPVPAPVQVREGADDAGMNENAFERQWAVPVSNHVFAGRERTFFCAMSADITITSVIMGRKYPVSEVCVGQ
jgi:hypothetical protein